MKSSSAWDAYPATYREREVRTLSRWVAGGQSGSLVGLPGCGRSNLLGYLVNRPGALRSYLPEQGASYPVAVVPLDLHTLPASDLATFYRVLLRAFHSASQAKVRRETGEHHDPDFQRQVARLYREHAALHDPFLTQSALYEMLHLYAGEYARVILLLNYFHHFLEEATPKMVTTLRGLRDSFKHTLSFIVGMPQEVAYLPQPELVGEMYELLDRNVCWIGAMEDADAGNVIARATRGDAAPPDVSTQAAIMGVAGNFPVLLHLVARWWLRARPSLPAARWVPQLLIENNLSYRLQKIWGGLTQEEQFALAALLRGEGEEYGPLFAQLAKKGVCQRNSDGGWQVQGALFRAYLEQVGPASRGRIWRDAQTQEIYQGTTPLTELTPLERKLLDYFLSHPHRPQEKDTLVEHLWPDKAERMTPNDLQQLIYRVRKKVDTQPPQYIVTWKGLPGGYQFYPEGRPGGGI